MIATGNRAYSQDSLGMPGRAETGDRFGGSFGRLSSALLVGVPSGVVGPHADAGALVVVRVAEDLSLLSTPPPQEISQNTPGVSSLAEPGDRFGVSVSVH